MSKRERLLIKISGASLKSNDEVFDVLKAKDIIKKHRKELDLIVETLMLLETIVKEQIDYIHKNLKLPPEAIEAKKANEKNSKNKSDDSSKSQIDDSIKPIDGKKN